LLTNALLQRFHFPADSRRPDASLVSKCLDAAACHAHAARAAGGNNIASPMEETMNLGTILLIVLVLALVGAIPAWPYNTGWGYYPAGGVGLLVLIVLILLIMGKI
jgi:hypothetical protein